MKVEKRVEDRAWQDGVEERGKGDRKGMTKRNGEEFNLLDFLTELYFLWAQFVRSFLFVTILFYPILFYSIQKCLD